MKKLLPKLIFPILIIIFALSCSGTGLLMSLENHGSTSGEHSCCTVNKSLGMSQGDMHNNVLFVHHETQSALLVLSVIALFTFFFYKNIFALSEIAYLQIKYYLQYWQRQARYYSLLLQRLFSLGILHSKTW